MRLPPARSRSRSPRSRHSVPHGGDAATVGHGAEDSAKRPLSTSLCGAYGAHAAKGLRSQAQSFVYEADRPFDPLKFEEWLEAGGPPRSIVRAKGLLWMHGVPRLVIFQLSGSRTNPFEAVADKQPPSHSTLVFIGEASALRDGDQSAITTALN